MVLDGLVLDVDSWIKTVKKIGLALI